MVKPLITKKEQLTIKYYSDHAEEWRSKHGQSGTYGRLGDEFELFFQLLPSGKVLEIGAGTGEDAVNLIKKYGVSNYCGIEPAEGLRKIAETNNLNATFINGTVYDIVDFKDKFDGFWASQILIHIPKKNIEKVLQIIKKVLKPHAIGMVSILQGGADGEESRPGRFYSLWSDEEFSKVLVKNGFEISHKRKLETGASPWLIYIVRKIGL